MYELSKQKSTTSLASIVGYQDKEYSEGYRGELAHIMVSRTAVMMDMAKGKRSAMSANGMS